MLQPIRTAIVDRHPLYATGLFQVLERAGDFLVLASGTTSEDALCIAVEHDLDVMLLDCGIADSESTVRAIGHLRPGLKVIVLVDPDDGRDVEKVLEAGAHDVVSKTIGGSDLTKLLRAEHQPLPAAASGYALAAEFA